LTELDAAIFEDERATLLGDRSAALRIVSLLRAHRAATKALLVNRYSDGECDAVALRMSTRNAVRFQWEISFVGVDPMHHALLVAAFSNATAELAIKFAKMNGLALRKGVLISRLEPLAQDSSEEENNNS
jgi:hypothetical protein